MANFCINCGTKLKKGDNFCANCGTKIDKSDIKQKKPLKFVRDILEKEMDKIAKEQEEAHNKLKTIDEIFESEEIKTEIRKNNVGQKHVISIKDRLKNKLIHNRERMSEEEIKDFIKTELKKAKIAEEKEKSSKNMRNTVQKSCCSWNCRHCYEEFLDSGGGIVGDFDSEGYVEYYCRLGHSVSFGSFCKDYE